MLFLSFISGKRILILGKWAKSLKYPGSLTSTQYRSWGVGDGFSVDDHPRYQPNHPPRVGDLPDGGKKRRWFVPTLGCHFCNPSIIPVSFSVFGKSVMPIAGCLLVNLEFLRFWLISWKSNLFTINEAHEQHSLLDTIFDHYFHFGPPGKYV